MFITPSFEATDRGSIMTVEELINKLQAMPQQSTIQLIIDSSEECMRVWSKGDGTFSVEKDEYEDSVVNIYAEDLL